MMKILKLVSSLVAISAACAAVLAGVDSLTKETIAKIRVKQALDAAAAVMPPSPVELKVEEIAPGVYAGKNAAGVPAGYAVRGSDPSGYGGDIVLMVGFTTDRKVVTYRKLVASETPGLGSNLSSESFMKQFAGIDAASPIAVRQDGGAIEAITSATITSRSVCGAVNAASAKLKEILAAGR